MRVITGTRRGYPFNIYELDVTDEMKSRALDFAGELILGNNQYDRLMPDDIRSAGNIDDIRALRIQRTYMGKLGELAFLQYLTEKGKTVDTTGMFEIYEGQENVDSFDFITADNKTVDVKTGFRSIHKRLLVNRDQFENSPKDFYVAVLLNARDTDRPEFVDPDSVTIAKIMGYADYAYLKDHCDYQSFGEDPAKNIPYTQLMGIDRLAKYF